MQHDSEWRYVKAAADRVMLVELTARYAFQIDYPGAGDGVEMLFVEDGCYMVPHLDFVASGRPAIRAMAELAAIARRHMHHVQTNHVFETSGDTASGRCEFNEFVTGHDGIIAYSQGWYEDDYVRTDAGWRFRTRKTHITDRIFGLMTSPEMVSRGFTLIDKLSGQNNQC